MNKDSGLVKGSTSPSKEPVGKPEKTPGWEAEPSKTEFSGRTKINKSDLPFFIIFGTTILKREFYFLTSIIMTTFLMAIVPTTLWLIDARNKRVAAYKENLSNAENRKTSSYYSLPQHTNIHNVMKWHIESSKANLLKSYQLHGIATIIDDPVELSVTILGNPPHYYRQDSWREWKSRVSTSFSYGEVNSEILTPGKQATTIELDNLDEAILWMESSIGYLCHTYLAEKKALTENEFEFSNLRFVKITDLEGRRYAVVESNNTMGFTVSHYIDFETGLETRRSCTVESMGTKKAIEVIYFYENLKKEIAQEDYMVPSGFLMKINGDPVYSVDLQKQHINPGLIRTLFATTRTEPRSI